MKKENVFSHLFNHLPAAQAANIRIDLMIQDALRIAAARIEASRVRRIDLTTIDEVVRARQCRTLRINPQPSHTRIEQLIEDALASCPNQPAEET